MLRRLLDRIGGEESTSRLLVTSSLWSVAMRLVGAAITFVVGVQLARYLGPAGLGIYGVVLGLATMLTSVAQLGLPMLATRELSVSLSSRDWPQLRGALVWFGGIVAAFGTLLGLVFLMVVLAVPDSNPGFREAVYWGAALVPVMAVTILLNAELRALGPLLKGQSLEILIRPAGIAAALFLVHYTVSEMTPALAMGANLAASALAMAVGLAWLRAATPRDARNAQPAAQPRRWLRSGAPLALTEVLRQLDGTYAVLVMGALATAAETGVFRVAASCVLAVALPLSVLHVVLAPTLARYRFEGQRAKLQRLLSLAALAMFASALAGTLAVALVGQWLIVALFGPEYAGAWIPLLLLCVAQAVAGLFGVAFVLLGVGGAERELARCFALSVAVSIAAAVPLTLALGATGAAMAAILGAAVNNGLAGFYVARRMGVDPTPLGLLRGNSRPGDGDVSA